MLNVLVNEAIYRDVTSNVRYQSPMESALIDVVWSCPKPEAEGTAAWLAREPTRREMEVAIDADSITLAR